MYDMIGYILLCQRHVDALWLLNEKEQAEDGVRFFCFFFQKCEPAVVRQYLQCWHLLIRAANTWHLMQTLERVKLLYGICSVICKANMWHFLLFWGSDAGKSDSGVALRDDACQADACVLRVCMCVLSSVLNRQYTWLKFSKGCCKQHQIGFVHGWPKVANKAPLFKRE